MGIEFDATATNGLWQQRPIATVTYAKAQRMTEFEFRTVPHIVLEAGAAARLAEIGHRVLEDVARVLVVSDQGVRGAGLLDAPVAALEREGLSVAVFDDATADPPESTVLAAAEEARRFGAEAIIGLGGGSSLDTAKLVAILSCGQQPLSEMYGVDHVSAEARLPLILVPTTAGTGSEVTPIAIVTTGGSTKMGVVAPQLYADLAVLDADLTLSLPRAVTAATGIDAMVHAIEAITSKIKRNPVSEALALAALSKLHGAIERACENGADRAARADMLLGALLAGQAFANAPVGAVHALAYPIGGIFHVPHGLSNSLVLPHVLRFNLDSAEADYARIAAHLGLPADAAALINECERIAEAVGIPRRLSEVDIQETDLPRMAEDAMLQTRLLKNNPKPVTQDDALTIYTEAL